METSPSIPASTSSIFSFSIAKTADMAPSPAGTVPCINFPLSLTTLMASSADIAPEATNAAYSPRLNPAQTSGFTPDFSTCFKIATQAVTNAGCVNSVI